MSDYKSLKDHVYNYISEQINSGVLKPNEKVNEKQISEKLGVSRTPVREALFQLSNEGYLERIPRKGFIVKEIKLERVKEVYQIIGVLESLAANSSINNIKSEDIQTMKKLVDKMNIAIKYNEFEEYFELQTKFHEVYIKKCDNKKLKELLKSLKMFFIKKTYHEQKSEDNIINVLKKTNAEHREIVKLFEKKDTTKIEKYLKDIHWNTKYAKFDSLEK
jgi:DNA-binding GntR family transcriptional regulator